jgi:acyl-CoA synthetase (AMP-forming)/AMP-acid ligase II
VEPDEAAFIVFTSGTTAAPRAVVHTQRSLGATVDLLAAHLKLRAGDVVYSGDLHAIVPALLAGATAVVPRRAKHIARDLARYRVSHAFGTPVDFQRLIETGRPWPHSDRSIVLGGAPIDRAFLGRLQQAIPSQTAVWCVYAMTEMLPVATISMADKLAYDGPGDIVGVPVPGVKAQLAADHELLLAGPHLASGYLGEAPVEQLASGDLARLDGLGRIVLLGRKKDMIIRGRDNIYPGLHEARIAEIDGVRRCSLIGLYDSGRADERIVLAVEPAPDQDLGVLERRLRTALPHCVDAAAQPDAIVFTAIPLDGRSNKVNRGLLRERVRQRLPSC